MIAATYAPQVSLEQVRRRLGPTPTGMTLAQVSEAAHALGLYSRGVRLDIDQLSELRLPAILHWDMDHFVVLARVRRRRALVSDPARGRHWISLRELGRHFTGVALELAPSGTAPDLPPRRAPLALRSLWPLARSAKPALWLTLLLSVLLQVLLLAGPMHVQWLVDDAMLAGDSSLIIVLASAFAALLLLRTGVLWLRGLLVAHLGHALALGFGSELLARLLALPLAWFGGRNTGDVAARFASLAPLRSFFTDDLAAFVVDTLIVVLALILMLAYAPALAAVVVGIQTLLVVAALIAAPRIRQLSQEMVVSQGADQAQLLESIRGIHSIKVYGLERQRSALWQKLHSRTLRASLDVQRWQTGVLGVATLVQGAELIVVLTLGAQSVLEGGGLTVGMLLAFVSFRGHFSERLRSGVERWLGFRTLRVHLDRVSDIWLEHGERAPVQPGARVSTNPETLELEDVSFAYDRLAPPVFEQLNLCVEPGEWLAVVGPSGAGKSTLLRMLMGLHAPSRGWLRIGGRRVDAETRVWHRSRCACVMQEDGFFSGSIAQNVALAHVWDEEELASVLEEVGLGGFLSGLPMGARTPLSDIVGQFSSGQMQRFYLARALYRRPDYLFLDEGTAHLDADNARLVRLLLGRLPCTRVTVTHDLAFAKAADRILTLQASRT